MASVQLRTVKHDKNGLGIKTNFWPETHDGNTFGEAESVEKCISEIFPTTNGVGQIFGPFQRSSRV